MPSGTAQCQVSSSSNEGAGGDGSSEWHLAALTLVLGVCEASDIESDSDSSAGSSVDQVVVDCSAAQQVRHLARGLAAADLGSNYLPPSPMKLEHLSQIGSEFGPWCRNVWRIQPTAAALHAQRSQSRFCPAYRRAA